MYGRLNILLSRPNPHCMHWKTQKKSTVQCSPQDFSVVLQELFQLSFVSLIWFRLLFLRRRRWGPGRLLLPRKLETRRESHLLLLLVLLQHLLLLDTLR